MSAATSLQAAFDELQQKLVPLWRSLERMNEDEQTIVVVPSLTLELPWLQGQLLQAYEERFLFMLMLLRQPRARMVFVTSSVIQPEIVDYYLELLPGVIPSHARDRLDLVSPLDGSPGPLVHKLLARPRLLERIRSLIADPDRAHLVPFLATDAERDLSMALGIPMYACDPRHLGFGTKSGARKLFAEEGVEHPLGAEDVRSLDDVADAIASIRGRRPAVQRVIVKHDEGVSGFGNATVDLTDVPAPGSPGEREAIVDAVRRMAVESAGSPAEHLAQLEREGGIVEERVSGREVRSPSVQMRVTPLGDLEILSTHDQLLGGPGGQTYEGATFPADPAYARAITDEARKVGHRLAEEGVLGRFAVDFVVVRDEKGNWDTYALEINLRKGGTTHPFLTLQFLTDGVYDADAGRFVTPSGDAKSFVASDHLDSDQYRGLTPSDLFDVAVRRGIHFDRSTQRGVVFHMLAAMGSHGRVGMTAIHDTIAEARDLYARAREIVDEEAEGSFSRR